MENQTTPQATIQEPPPELTGERLEVAAMVIEAARRLCASLSWHKPLSGYHWAIICGLTEDEEVTVEPVSKKMGALIESGDSDRRSYYETADALVATIRGRFARQRAAAKRDAEADAERRRREASGVACRQAAKAQLVETFGQELVDACMFVDDFFPKDGSEPRAHVNVHVGRRISGEKLSVTAATRFTQAMLSAGYDLVKLADEVDVLNK